MTDSRISSGITVQLRHCKMLSADTESLLRYSLYKPRRETSKCLLSEDAYFIATAMCGSLA